MTKTCKWYLHICGPPAVASVCAIKVYISYNNDFVACCREFYHPHAFLCDKEKAEKTEKLIAYGISHLDFDM